MNDNTRIPPDVIPEGRTPTAQAAMEDGQQLGDAPPYAPVGEGNLSAYNTKRALADIQESTVKTDELTPIGFLLAGLSLSLSYAASALDMLDRDQLQGNLHRIERIIDAVHDINNALARQVSELKEGDSNGSQAS